MPYIVLRAAAFVITAGFICLACKYRRLRRKYRLLKKEAETQAALHSIDELKLAEYLALQNQINPHFLYNTLEAVRSDAICAGAKDIANTVKALATFFRYTITDVGTQVLLEDEINNVENYFMIQKYRFSALNLEIMVPPELLQARTPKLILQPVVENAIIHGLEKKVGLGTVKLCVDTTRKNLLITVKDDGVGIEEDELARINEKLNRVEDAPSKQGGIAMVNVNSRIKLIFGEDYGMHIYSLAGAGTTVEIILPLIIEKRGL